MEEFNPKLEVKGKVPGDIKRIVAVGQKNGFYDYSLGNFSAARY